VDVNRRKCDLVRTVLIKVPKVYRLRIHGYEAIFSEDLPADHGLSCARENVSRTGYRRLTERDGNRIQSIVNPAKHGVQYRRQTSVLLKVMLLRRSIQLFSKVNFHLLQG
jgi:hypothetical protein